MKNRIVTYILIALITAAFLVGAFAAFQRSIIESNNSSVEIVMDLSDIKKLSILEGYPIDKLLHELKNSGITSIAVVEDTLESLELEGLIVWLTGYERDTLLKIGNNRNNNEQLTPKARIAENKVFKSFIRRSRPNPALSYVVCNDPVLLNRIRNELVITLGNNQVRQIALDAIEVTDDEEDLMNLGVGVSRDKFSFVVDRGFFVVPRLKNNFRLNSNKIGQKFLSLMYKGPFNTVIFDGEEVLGYKNNISDTAKVLGYYGINFGYIEMSGQKGDSMLLKDMGTNIVRVHSISEDEMIKKMTKEQALDRFERAVAERGVRMLFIRPFYTPDKDLDLIKTNTGYISELKRRLAVTGHGLGIADRPEQLSPKINALIILSLGVASGILLLLLSFIEIPASIVLLFLIVSALLPAAFKQFANIIHFEQLAALACAIVFPSLAITSVFKKREDPEFDVFPFAKSILLVLMCFVISMVGAVLVIGLLSDTLFMLGARQFVGIKISFILPIFIAAAYCALNEGNIKSGKEKLIEWLNSPITVMAVIVGMIVLAAGALYILRSGNFGIGIFGSERAIRAFLENIMVVRPRTKEFLIGYPALALASMYYLRGGRQWLWAFIIIGIIGPVSTLNTFCHIHSPLLLSMLRSVYGVLIGIAVGLIYYCIYLLFKRLLKA